MDNSFTQVSVIVLALTGAGCILNTMGISGSDNDSMPASAGQTTSIQPTTSGSTTAGSSGVSSQCGDGVVEQDENCDDGNQDNQDGCQSDCTPTQGVAVYSGSFAFNTCVRLFSDKQVRCWGYNHFGQLGYDFLGMIPPKKEHAIGDSPDELIRDNTVIFHEAVDELAMAWEYSCARTASGAVYCWGAEDWCKLGMKNDVTRVGVPWRPQSPEERRIDLGIDGNAKQISAGGYSACAVLGDGTLQCWGNNASGQIGNEVSGDCVDGDTPVNVDVGAAVKQVSVGYLHTCALTDEGDVKCWGVGGDGRLGNGPGMFADVGEPPSDPVQLGVHVQQVTAGFQHTCVVHEFGDVRCWGLNDKGQLGRNPDAPLGDAHPGSTDMDVDLDIMSDEDVVWVGAGINHTCARTDKGRVFCWGSNYYGQLGYGFEYLGKENVGDDKGLTPAEAGPVPLEAPAIELAVGGYHTCALLESGALRCWGRSDVGQLGLGNIDPENSPVAIPYF